MPQKIACLILLLLTACSPSIDTPLKQIKYPNTDMRVHAAEKLGDSGHPNAAPALIDALKDEKLRVRLAAINALGTLKDKRATGFLLPFLHDKKVIVVFAAIEALGNIGDATAVDSLCRFVSSELPTTRLAAIDALGKIGSSDAIDILSDQLWNASAAVRSVTALALARIGDPKSIWPLLQIISDPSPQVYKMALYALDTLDTNWRNHEDTQIVLQSLVTELMTDDIVGDHAALKRFGLLNGLNAIDPQWHNQDWAPHILAHYAAFLESPNHRERWVAARVLGELKDTRAVDALVSSLNDPDYSVRSRAILSLGALGDARAMPVLRAILQGDDLRMKNPAITALAQLADTTSIPLIIAQLTPEAVNPKGNRAGRNIPYAVAVALGNLNATQAGPILRDLLHHPSSGVRQQAVRSLGKIKDMGAVDDVIAALGDRNRHVRTAAAKALGKLGAEKAVFSLVQTLGSGKVANAVLVASLDSLNAQWRSLSPAKEKVQQLIVAFETGDAFTKQEMVDALAEMGGDDAHTVLLGVLKRRDLRLIAQAHAYYIRHGVSQAVPALRQALEGYGTQKMVKTYLASGHPVLTEVARTWAHAHGMALVSMPGIEKASWSGG